MSSDNGAAPGVTPDTAAPGALSDIGSRAGATEVGRSTGGGPGAQRIRGACDDCAGIGAPCTEGTAAGGVYCGSLIGQRGICADVPGIVPGGRGSSAYPTSGLLSPKAATLSGKSVPHMPGPSM